MPLIALLRRRLSDDEVRDIVAELVEAGQIDRTDIQVAITKVTNELPHESDVERVRAKLEAGGWTAGEQP